jgi:[acyl-carrier-protein] S-malonyltransferase
VGLTSPIALVFPGQGVQQPGMAKRLYDRYPQAREAFARAEDTLRIPLRQLSFDGPAEELNRTSNLQPAVLTASWAAFEVYRDLYGPNGVSLAAGHSLGEFAALAASGALTWEEALHLVHERGRVMESAALEQPGAMLAVVGLDENQIAAIRAEAAPAGDLWIANRNSEVQFVLSGSPGAIARAERLALQKGARRALVLTIPLAAHSPLMERAAARFQQIVEALPLRAPRLPVLANAGGEVLGTAEAIRDELVHHLLRPVDWAKTMVSMQLLKVRTVVELGPGRVLASLAAKHMPGVETWNADELFIDYAPVVAS